MTRPEGPDPPARGDPFLSVVVPVYDEEEVLPLLLPRLRAALQALAGGWEVFFVNDGSTDRSMEILREEGRRDRRIKVVDLSRNFGHSIAITAGLDYAGGDAVVVMDGDLQDPPELIPDMVALYKQGYDVVHARRAARRKESLFKRLTAWLFYAIMRQATHRALEANVGEFRLMSREVVASLRRLRERHRLVRGMVAWVGFRQTVLDFDRPGRAAGVTKYPLSKMLRLAWDGIASFSAAPLRLAMYLGAGALVVGIGYAAYAIYIGYVRGLGVPGWTSLVTLHIFFSGVVLLCLGLIGEYVGRIFEEVKGRPLYLVKGEVNVGSGREVPAEPVGSAGSSGPPPAR